MIETNKTRIKCDYQAINRKETKVSLKGTASKILIRKFLRENQH